MVINLQIHDWNVSKVVIDSDSSTYILYYEAFQGLKLYLELLHHFKRALVSLLGKQVQVMGYVTIKTTFGFNESATTIKVKYMVINSPSPYNIIIGRQTFNT